MIRKIASSALVFLFLAASVQAAEDNWPSFRGGNAMSQVQDDPRLPDSWSETENVAWKIDVPGLAWSSPVIWGDRVFVTSVARATITIRRRGSTLAAIARSHPKTPTIGRSMPSTR